MAENTKQHNTYGSNAIKVLRGLIPIRARPGMYIGDDGKRGMHHLISEVLDNSVDESMQGHCDKIVVTLHEDGRSVTIEDNGRGIPSAIHPEENKSTLEVVLTKIHAGGKFGGADSGYDTSGGLHGVGISCVTALSENMEVRVWRNDKKDEDNYGEHVIVLSRGEVVNPVSRENRGKPTMKRGTAVTFTPDRWMFGATMVLDVFNGVFGPDEIPNDAELFNANEVWKEARVNNQATEKTFLECFGYILDAYPKKKSAQADITKEPYNDKAFRQEVDRKLRQAFARYEIRCLKNTHFDEEVVLRRLEQIAFLNANLSVVYLNEASGREETYVYQGGIADYVKSLTAVRGGLYPSQPFSMDKEIGRMRVMIAFQYSEDDDESITTFANNIHNPDGGTHLSGFKAALTRLVNQYARANTLLKEKESNLSGDDIREGITAIIAVRIPQPQFEGQTKAKLTSPEMDGVVNSAFSEGLGEFFEKNPVVAKAIVERAILAARARDAAKKQSDLIKRKTFLGKGHRLPGKLKDCQTNDRTIAELFLVEGDSAAGSAKEGRDANTQAVLPLRGKIINAEKTDLASLLKNQEVQNIINALGTGVDVSEGDFKLGDRRYDKVIIMSVDGDERVLLRNKDSLDTSVWRCGEFIDGCYAGIYDHSRFEVCCFDPKALVVRFKPIKAAIRHISEDVRYRITTLYGRSATVTGGHSLFTVDNGVPSLRQAHSIKEEDLILAPSKIDIPASEVVFDIWSMARVSPSIVSSLAVSGLEHWAGAFIKQPVKMAAHDMFRMIPLTPSLAYFMGWFAAEGSLSGFQIKLALAEKDMAHFAKIAEAVREAFGQNIRVEEADSKGPVACFHSTAAALIIHQIGLAVTAKLKRVPSVFFNSSEECLKSFLEGYFLGVGSMGEANVSMTTASKDMKEDLPYVFLRLGVLVDVSHIPPSENELACSGEAWRLSITGRDNLCGSSWMWQNHWGAEGLMSILSDARTMSSYTPVSDSLIGLPVRSIERMDPSAEYVYDFSVEGDETFICGTGGLCAHNTDADVDGSHIATLLLTFMYRYMRPLVIGEEGGEGGYVYLANPPLFKVESANKKVYCWSDEERDSAVANSKGKSHIVRYKGLGEMNDDELAESTMEVQTRRLTRVAISDAPETDGMLSILMGKNVAARKEHIIKKSAERDTTSLGSVL